MGWEWRENNRDKVVAALRRGEYEAILTSKGGLGRAGACGLGVGRPSSLSE